LRRSIRLVVVRQEEIATAVTVSGHMLTA